MITHSDKTAVTSLLSPYSLHSMAIFEGDPSGSPRKNSMTMIDDRSSS